MGRTTEEPLPVPKEYRRLVASAAREIGTQSQIADAVGVDQSTISRVLGKAQHPATYTTWRRLAMALHDHGVPPPVVCVGSADHYQLAELAGVLEHVDPEAFRELLASAKRAARLVTAEMGSGAKKLDSATVAKLKELIAHPRGVRKDE
jgi:hypothetical protein